ncbi:MAG: energy transducer TonB [Synergistaceae bacterium]
MDQEKKIWSIAIIVSIVFHLGLLIFYPEVEKEKELPIMNVTLRMMTSSKPKEQEGKKLEQPKKEQIKPKQPQNIVKKKKKEIKKEEKRVATDISTKTTETSIEELVEATSNSATTDVGNATGETGQGTQGHGSGNSGGESVGPVDVRTLIVTRKVIPEYPAFSRKRKEEGTVTIIVTIDNGRVTKTEIEKSSGWGRLDASAVRAVEQWRFESPVKVRARIPITFLLQ